MTKDPIPMNFQAATTMGVEDDRSDEPKKKANSSTIFCFALVVGRGGCRIKIGHHGLIGEGHECLTCRTKK